MHHAMPARPSPADHRQMSPETRTQAIAEILAAGIVRLRQRAGMLENSSKTSQIRLDDSAGSCVHGRHDG